MDLFLVLASFLSLEAGIDDYTTHPGWWLPSKEECSKNYFLAQQNIYEIDAMPGTLRHINQANREWNVYCKNYWWAAWWVRWPDATINDRLIWADKLRPFLCEKGR